MPPRAELSLQERIAQELHIQQNLVVEQGVVQRQACADMVDMTEDF